MTSSPPGTSTRDHSSRAKSRSPGGMVAGTSRTTSRCAPAEASGRRCGSTTVAALPERRVVQQTKPSRVSPSRVRSTATVADDGPSSAARAGESAPTSASASAARASPREATICRASSTTRWSENVPKAAAAARRRTSPSSSSLRTMATSGQRSGRPRVRSAADHHRARVTGRRAASSLPRASGSRRSGKRSCNAVSTTSACGAGRWAAEPANTGSRSGRSASASSPRGRCAARR